MEKESELLMRAALHDLANVLAGVQGVADLTPEGAPLSPRNRARLEAVLAEGQALLGRARHLAMGTLPEGAAEPGEDWRARLAGELRPMALLYRAPVEVEALPGPGPDTWPGDLLRSFARSAARQLLPYAREGLRIQTRAAEGAWELRFTPAPTLPEALQPAGEVRAGQPLDINARWTQRVAGALGLTLVHDGEGLTCRIPRP